MNSEFKNYMHITKLVHKENNFTFILSEQVCIKLERTTFVKIFCVSNFDFCDFFGKLN